MIFKLLLDLDDTLLETNLDAFLPAYFNSLSNHAAAFVPSEKAFNTHLLGATQAMYGSRQPNLTLEQAFDAAFYPNIGLEKEQMAEMLDDFYDHEFPKLGRHTRVLPKAIELVEYAFAQGWEVTIATDPLFPRKATLSRLRWANLAPEQYPFRFISDFHTFHFAKSSIAYFPELLAWLDWDGEPTLMVGDSLERDIQPAQSAGLPVFWLTDSHSDTVPFPHGNYADLQAYLATTDLASLRVNLSQPKAILAFLLATPAFFHSFLRHTNPGEDSGSPASELIFELCDAELNVNAPWIAAILRTGYAGEDGEDGCDTDLAAEAFATFTSGRMSLINSLKALSAEQWQDRLLGGVLHQILHQDRQFLKRAYNLLHL